MKIALINASPKVKMSASEVLLNIVEDKIEKSNEIINIKLRKAKLTHEDKKAFECADVLVFAFPLYVDGIPGHLLYCLREIEKMNLPPKSVYAIMNCGFYEGEQNRFAFDVMKNWCYKTGFYFNGGVGIGGGGCIVTISNMGSESGPMKPIFKALSSFSKIIECNKKVENSYLSVGLPRFFYKFAAQLNWRQAIIKNGGKIKDIANRPEE